MRLLFISNTYYSFSPSQIVDHNYSALFSIWRIYTTVYYRLFAAILTSKIRCRNDDVAICGGHQNLRNFPEEIRLLTNRHLLFHFGGMNMAPIQSAMTELEKLRLPLTSNSVVQHSFYMLIAINHQIHSSIFVYFK